MKYMIVNDFDPNDSFYVEAENDEEAYHEALKELGWWVAMPSKSDEDDEASDELCGLPSMFGEEDI